MSLWEIVAIVVAGFLAGTINAVVGSGTLVTFPTLLFFGHPPVTANISNTLGLTAGGMSAAWGYRGEIRGLGGMLLRLLPCSLLGSIMGALLLLVLPPAAFEAIVPALILVGVLLVVLGPKINRRTRGEGTQLITPGRWVALVLGVFVAGVYGGYFGAAQGVIIIGLMSLLLPLGVQAINGLKNVLSLVVNIVAAVVFLVVDPGQIDWRIVGLVAGGSLLGGFAGARLGRRLPPLLLRGIIVAVGLLAIGYLLLT